MGKKVVVIVKNGSVHGLYDECGNKVAYDVFDEGHEKLANFEKVVNIKAKLGDNNRVLIRKLGVRPDIECDKFMIEVGFEFEGQLVNTPEVGKQLFAISDSNHYFKTSPVTKITDDHDDTVVETNNSIYLIEKRGI